eukprot:8922160-Pyramimonas_sp.AAC.1
MLLIFFWSAAASSLLAASISSSVSSHATDDSFAAARFGGISSGRAELRLKRVLERRKNGCGLDELGGGGGLFGEGENEDAGRSAQERQPTTLA